MERQTEKVKETFDLFGLTINVSGDHRFGTDALLLARFSVPSKKDVVCDLCTGCGIIPMLFEAWGKAPEKAYALDIQKEAIDLLRGSVAENHLEEKIVPVLGDLTKKDELLRVPRGVTLVTANPPYFKSRSGAERLSPAQAAARHELLCNLEQVIAAAAELLKYGGTLKMCHIPERLTDVMCLMRKYGIEPKIMQFAHNSRADSRPYLVLIAGKKGGKPGLIVEKPALVEDMNRELFK